MANKKICGRKCDVYSRVCGYYSPTRLWNKGKKEEFKDRVHYNVKEGIKNDNKENNSSNNN